MKRLVLLGATALAMLISAPSAFAYSDYCGYLLNPSQRCDALGYPNTKQTHSATDQNRARYPGSGTISVCERIEYGYGGALLSRVCGNSSGSFSVTSGWSSFGFSTSMVGNNSPWAHTVDGRVDYH